MREILKSILLLSFCLINTLCEESQWPDLRCHPGYNNATTNMEYGQGRMLYALENCKSLKDNPTAENCFKGCMLEQTLIVERFNSDQFELPDEDGLEINLNSIFFSFGEDGTARRIANQLVSKCSSIVKQSEHIPCADKAEVYKCLEDAWAC